MLMGGGQLPKILNGIVDAIPDVSEVLRISGRYDEGYFSPDAGQPTKSDAIDAFLAGRVVLVRTENADEEINYVTITSYDFTAGVLRGIGFSWGE